MNQTEFFNQYKFDTDDDFIGGGGFGKVYKAFDDVNDRYFAIKVSEVNKGQENFSLLKEVELAAKLSQHKNIANYEQCYRFKTPHGTFDYGILQYYPAGNLSDIISKVDLTIEQKEAIANGIINGIEHLHNNDIVHRDLKSSNILIAERSNGAYIPKIADFGLSKQFNETDKSYFSNSFAGGSLLYVAPEQLIGGQIRKNVDLWSLGVVLFELFTGKLPFLPKSEIATETGRAEIVQQINSGAIPNSINEIPEKWQNAIKKCLVVDSENRIKSVKELFEVNDSETSEITVSQKAYHEETVIQSNDPNGASIAKENNTESKSNSEKLPEKNKAKGKRVLPVLLIGALVICAFAVGYYLITKNSFSNDVVSTQSESNDQIKIKYLELEVKPTDESYENIFYKVPYVPNAKSNFEKKFNQSVLNNLSINIEGKVPVKNPTEEFIKSEWKLTNENFESLIKKRADEILRIENEYREDKDISWSIRFHVTLDTILNNFIQMDNMVVTNPGGNFVSSHEYSKHYKLNNLEKLDTRDVFKADKTDMLYQTLKTIIQARGENLEWRGNQRSSFNAEEIGISMPQISFVEDGIKFNINPYSSSHGGYAYSSVNFLYSELEEFYKAEFNQLLKSQGLLGEENRIKTKNGFIIPKSAKTTVEHFLNLLDKGKFTEAHQFVNNPSWGDLAKFSSTSGWGGISSVEIHEVRELSYSAIEKANLTSCKCEEVVYAHYTAKDPVNGDGTFSFYFFLEQSQNSTFQIIKAKLKSMKAKTQSQSQMKKKPESASKLTTASGLQIEIYEKGKGEPVTKGKQIKVHYTGTLKSDGSKFDSSRDRGQPLPVTVGKGQVIKGWDEGLQHFNVGGRGKLTIPPHLGYGNRTIGKIPANSTMIFDIEILE